MSRIDDWVERRIDAFVTRVSGRTVAITTLLLYPGFGLALPLGLGWSVPNLIAMNLAGVSLAATISLGWLMVKLDAKDRRQLLEWTTDLRLLSAEEFEWLVGELFRREGWKVQETGSQDGPDGNVDLELAKGEERRLVQCKRWTSYHVGVEHIRAFAGTLLREGLDGGHGVFVTLSRFTSQAGQEAEKDGIELIDGRDLFRRVEQVRRSEPCPACHRAMVLDRSQHGWWFRCVAPGCAGKRNLDREPARAVDLLTQGPATRAIAESGR